ncbi:hypothetical protein D3C81_1767810 [compost metagenome]
MHLRIQLEKFADHLRQKRVRQTHRARHPQAASGFAGHAGYRLVGHLCFQQHGLTMTQVALAHRRQLELAGGALQQARAQAFFQLGDTP